MAVSNISIAVDSSQRRKLFAVVCAGIAADLAAVDRCAAIIVSVKEPVLKMVLEDSIAEKKLHIGDMITYLYLLNPLLTEDLMERNEEVRKRIAELEILYYKGKAITDIKNSAV